MSNEEINIKIVEQIIDNDFDSAKVQKLLHPSHLDFFNQISLITHQLVSFYKVTFVEEGIDKIDTISVCIFLSFVSIIKERFKNMSNDYIVESLDKVIELLYKFLCYFNTKRQISNNQ
jgi:hypothetical protein